MAIDVTSPRSRRALLGAVVGAGAATIAQALGRPLPARAADGDYVRVGYGLTATSTTQITNQTNSLAVLSGQSSYGYGVWGSSSNDSGVVGSSISGDGVVGTSISGDGVRGRSDGAATAGVFGHHLSDGTAVLGFSGPYGSIPAGLAKTGVHGRADQDAGAVGVLGHSGPGIGVVGQSSAQIGTVGRATGATGATFGVFGRSDSPAGIGVGGRGYADGTGVVGYSGSASFPAAVARTGVYGRATQDTTARGVHGYSTSGRGVYGQATSGTGLYGQATSGTGLYGQATTGYALRAVGRVKLDRCAGVATILAAKSSVVVTPGIDLVSTSAVVATLMGNAGGSTTVKRVAVNTTTNTFTIYLTANATANVKVAWHVFG